MRKLIYILFILIIPTGILATEQQGDKLIWNGDTLTISSNPLELRGDIDYIRSKLLGEKNVTLSTSCWRGYIAEWIIIENEMYLTNLFNCNLSSNIIKFDLKNVFGSECINGMVKATWVTMDILIPTGKRIHYIHSGYDSFYEKELVLSFKNGVLVKQKEYDNSKSHKSIFTENQDTLDNFIYTNIDWDIIPDLKDEKTIVYVSVLSSSTPKPDSIFISKGATNEILNNEALRVANLIPEWNVYYRLGVVHTMKWTFPIVFNEENRKKYNRW